MKKTTISGRRERQEGKESKGIDPDTIPENSVEASTALPGFYWEKWKKLQNDVPRNTDEAHAHKWQRKRQSNAFSPLFPALSLEKTGKSLFLSKIGEIAFMATQCHLILNG